ncbi:hypothetical protein MANES_15G030550v8 [Manihot esculenta]|uniref:Uncharacterized protein n=1 Tax=Manihot esculenta TaxID=3983 RepID=A0ACB7GAF2_MANES|nr:hypothetical protein MANES_15G030550v8 [Manihot esculenta]
MMEACSCIVVVSFLSVAGVLRPLYQLQEGVQTCVEESLPCVFMACLYQGMPSLDDHQLLLIHLTPTKDCILLLSLRIISENLVFTFKLFSSIQAFCKCS